MAPFVCAIFLALGAALLTLLVLTEFKKHQNERGMDVLEAKINSEVEALNLKLPRLRATGLSLSQRMHICEKYAQLIYDTKKKRGII